MKRIKNHEDYLEKLLLKEIKIIPLEEYTGYRNKILHKCTCGNEWLVSPMSVCLGNHCGCKQLKRDYKDNGEQYLNKLNNKGILLKPIAKYIDSKTKILHRCICGKDIYLSPRECLRGKTCNLCNIDNNKPVKIHNNSEYLEILKYKDIKTIPLENFNGYANKILHKCICGNEWRIIPSSVIRGNTCGCKERPLKWNNIYYLQQLKHLDINIIPMEKYKNGKFLHKCICGNEWLTTAERVLSGFRCGCGIAESGLKRRKTNEEYLQQLKVLNIHIIPLEILKPGKMLHKCICGNEWLVTSTGVLSGNHCGCKKRLNSGHHNIEFYRDKKTVLYYIKIKGLWKIGVTLFKESIENSMKNRWGKEEIEILQTEVFEDGSIAFQKEQDIINSNWKVKYCGENIINGGNTELFIEDIRT